MYNFCGGITTRPGDVVSHQQSTIYAEGIYIYQKDFSDTVIEADNTHFICTSIYIDKGGAPVVLTDAAFFRSRWFHGNTLYGFAFTIGWNSVLHIDPPVSRTTIQGVTGFIYWEFNGTNLSTRPNEGDFVSVGPDMVATMGGGV